MNVEVLTKGLDLEKIEYSASMPMSGLTTFKIGGPADVVVMPQNKSELKKTINLCKDNDIPVMILGKGSNLLISDDGIDGAVIKISKGFDEICLIDDTTVYCGAGAPLSVLCSFCCEHSLSGLEFAFGIPGSVGGAVYMNAGAYGGEIKDVITSASYMTENGEEREFSESELCLGYRKSVFTGSKNIILGATFKLKPAKKEDIRFAMDDFLSRRKDKQPLQYPSAGSTFKRPEGHFAGALIEQSGLKGFSIGGAQVSEKHAGFVVNTGNATCEDVMSLMKHISDTVYKNFGVTLEAEIIKRGR